MKSLGLFFSFVSSSLQRRNLKVVGILLAIFVGLARARPVPEPGDEAPVAAAQSI